MKIEINEQERELIERICMREEIFLRMSEQGTSSNDLNKEKTTWKLIWQEDLGTIILLKRKLRELNPKFLNREQ